MDAALVIAFYVAVAVLLIRVRRVNLAVGALMLTALLVVALIVQATVSERLGGFAALGLTLAVVSVALAVRFGLWVGGNDEAGSTAADSRLEAYAESRRSHSDWLSRSRVSR